MEEAHFISVKRGNGKSFLEEMDGYIGIHYTIICEF